MPVQNSERLVEGEVTVNAPADDVWRAWTTGEGAEWDAAIKYFETAWKRIVLPRLKDRFGNGPIDWDRPPDVKKP